MPLYLINTDGKDDHRLISADTRARAEHHFMGKHELVSKTISDPAEGAELAAKYSLEKISDAVPAGDPTPINKPDEETPKESPSRSSKKADQEPEPALQED